MSKIKYAQLSDKQWLENELKTKSIHLVAKQIGCSYAGVVYAIKKLQITIDSNNSKKRRESPLKSQNIKLALHKKYPNGRFGELAANWGGGLGNKRTKLALHKKYPNGRFGELAANWGGGIRRCGKNGAYVGIYSPKHPQKNGDNYVMEHRLVMEKHLGRYLDPKEIVHHKNGIKHDNRIENLELVASRGTHTKEHFERSHITEQLWDIVNSCNHCKTLAQKQKLC